MVEKADPTSPPVGAALNVRLVVVPVSPTAMLTWSPVERVLLASRSAVTWTDAGRALSAVPATKLSSTGRVAGTSRPSSHSSRSRRVNDGGHRRRGSWRERDTAASLCEVHPGERDVGASDRPGGRCLAGG